MLCFFTLQPDDSASDVHSSLALLAVTVLFLAVMMAILITSASSVKESLFVLTLLHRTPPLCSCVTCFPLSLLSPPPYSFILSPGASPHLSLFFPVISELIYYLLVYERQGDIIGFKASAFSVHA